MKRREVEMKTVIWTIVGIFFITCAAPEPSAGAGVGDLLKTFQKSAGSQGNLSNGEIVEGLKEALKVGTQNAVQVVSRVDGYYKNPEIKIPLPAPVQNVESLLRAAGFGATIDELDLSMNRAAENAAPQAKVLFLDTIKKMSFTDAQRILSGPKDAATLYFKDKTGDQIQALFKPIVKDSMSKVGVTRSYQELTAQVKTIPFAGNASFDLDQYVTGKATDGLFTMLAKEEANIRTNPTARVTDLLKKVFANH
ncbi:MAG: DUF4197 domain-containing protein [Desulfobacterales bacterium]